MAESNFNNNIDRYEDIKNELNSQGWECTVRRLDENFDVTKDGKLFIHIFSIMTPSDLVMFQNNFPDIRISFKSFL